MPAILLLGIITSYQDIKFGKIRNKWIILALVYAILAYTILISFYLSKGNIRPQYLAELGTNLLFSIVVGFGLWYLNVWTAGDGKLFIAYSALIPLSAYSIGYQKWIPSLTLVINIFVAALAIMLILVLFKTRIKDIKKVSIGFLKEFFQPKQLLDSIIYLFAIFWIMQILLSLIGLGNNYFLRIALTLIALSFMQKKLGNKTLYIMIIISLARFIIDRSVYSLSFLTNFIILILIWRFFVGFLRGGISKLGHEIFSKKIKVDKLKPGMILSETIQKKEKITEQELKALKKQAKTILTDITITRYKKNYYIQKPKYSSDLDNFIKEEAEGLTQQQIDKIKKIGIKNIKVSQTIPFAPFIFLGVILTIISNGNILIVIKALI